MRLAEETCKGNNAACVMIIVPQSELVWPSSLCLKASNSDIWSYLQHTNRLDSGRIYGVIIFTQYLTRSFRQDKDMPKHSPSDLKLETLRQQGTLNPRPQDVTDDLFETSEFFDARDVVQVKYEMLRRVEKEGRPITEAAAVFGFSRPSFYQAQSAFEQDGLAGLVPRKRGPKEAHKLTREIVEFLQQIRQEDPSLRSADLTERVAKRFGVAVHPRTIERGLARHQKKRRKPV